MTMREKIARAIIDDLTDRRRFRHVFDNLDDDVLADIKSSIADAVLDAMREPTPGMIAAGRVSLLISSMNEVGQKLTDQSYVTYFTSNDNIAALFATMIDAAKGETE